MQIPSYQISNVIKVYSKQLSQSRILNRQDSSGSVPNKPLDTIKISDEGKKQTLINKVSDEVFSRITKYSPQDPAEQDIVNKLNNEIKKNQKGSIEKNKFVFNFISDENEKVTNAISIEGSKVLSERLDNLVRNNVAKDMES